MSEIKEKATPTTNTSPLADQSIIDRMTAVFKEAMKAELDEFKLNLKAEREKIVKENSDELEKSLRIALGVDKDLPVTRSQIAEVVRKAMLETTESQKKTPAPIEKGGPDGNVKPDPFDEMAKAKLGEPITPAKGGIV